MQISAVVPVYAETGALVEVVEGLHDVLGGLLAEVLIVVVPAAPDPTWQTCARLARRYASVRVVPQRRGPGLGWAVRQGIDEATGTHVLMIDSDGEMRVATVPLLVAALRADAADMAVASRWIEGGGAEGYSRIKYVLNRGFQAIFRRVYRTHLHDLTLGFKLARADILKAIPWRGRFHEIACETTLRPVRLGCRVVEVPTVWHRRAQGTSSNPFRRNVRYVATALAVLRTPRGIVS